jgi:hypothetical protein
MGKDDCCPVHLGKKHPFLTSFMSLAPILEYLDALDMMNAEGYKGFSTL